MYAYALLVTHTIGYIIYIFKISIIVQKLGVTIKNSCAKIYTTENRNFQKCNSSNPF